MTKTLQVGLIGLGRVAWSLENDPLERHPCTHAGAWLSLPDIAIVAGCDEDADARSAFVQQYPNVRVYADYAEMLAIEQLDCISICAYATERKDMVVAAADSGVRGIWCEKAMACSLEEVSEMADTLARQKTKMIVSYLRRWDPPYQWAIQLIEEGAIGKLQSIHAQFSGNMLHTGTHAFDVMRMFAGEVATVTAWLDIDNERNAQSGYKFEDKETEHEDYGGHAVLHFENGVYAVVHGDDKGYFRFEFELIGSEGMLRIGNTQLELWQSAPSTHYTDFNELEQTALSDMPEGNMWIKAAADLARAVRDNANDVACSVEDGRASLAISLAMHQSHKNGHQPVAPLEVLLDLRVPSR